MFLNISNTTNFLPGNSSRAEQYQTEQQLITTISKQAQQYQTIYLDLTDPLHNTVSV